jgi:cell wall-associated NlpC family hydrolase
VSGSACKSAKVTLTSVSLFEGAVTATSVEATDGKGAVAGLAIDGTPVSAARGQTIDVGGWGQLTLGAKFGRVTAPLVLNLLQAHGPLRAGTTIAVAFSAAAPSVPTPQEKRRSTSGSGQPSLNLSQRYAKGSSAGDKHGREVAKSLDLPENQPYPFLIDGGGLTPAARRDPVVSIAMRYLGIRYQWGGASPGTGFDCSGLVQYVFGKVGVTLVHYAASQYYYPGAVWVSPKRLQPGDLVFFTGSDGTRRSPGHVGIYVDDGYFIDAPHTGSYVRIDSLTDPRFANEYVAARRIVGASRARHLFHASNSNASVPGFPVGFPTPVALEPLGETLGTADPTASRDWIWGGAAALGTLLLLLGSGAIVLRRRRRAY